MGTFASILLRAVSEPGRRKVLKLLRKAKSPKGMTATEIESRLRLAQPTVSHHMGMLKQARVVTAERQGTFVWYRRNEAVIRELYWCCNCITPCIEAALAGAGFSLLQTECG